MHRYHIPMSTGRSATPGICHPVTIPVTTGISNAAAERTNGMAARYHLNGSKVAETQSGLQIVRMADGTVKKIMKR